MTEYQGKVKWYDPNKAFGFICGAPEGDVFIHRSNIEPGRDQLIEGQEVLFKVRRSPRGFEAFDVTVTAESSLPPRPLRPREDFGRERPQGRPDRSRERDFSRPPIRPSSLPKGPITATVISKDKDDRFMFVRSERDDFEVFVHSSLFRDFAHDVRRGDRVRVTVEASAKGVRATSLELT